MPWNTDGFRRLRGISRVYPFRFVFAGIFKTGRIIKNPDNLTKSYRRFETPVGSGAEVGSSIGESCSALSAASLENLSAVGSSHSLSEAVFHFSLPFLGLICSEHSAHLLTPVVSIYENQVLSLKFHAVRNQATRTALYIIKEIEPFCQ